MGQFLIWNTEEATLDNPEIRDAWQGFLCIEYSSVIISNIATFFSPLAILEGSARFKSYHRRTPFTLLI